MPDYLLAFLLEADLQEQIHPLQQGLFYYPSSDPPMFHITGEYTLVTKKHTRLADMLSFYSYLEKI